MGQCKYIYLGASTVAAVVCFSEDGSIPPSSQGFSGHMVGHMALAGLGAWVWAGHRWWALDVQGGGANHTSDGFFYPHTVVGKSLIEFLTCSDFWQGKREDCTKGGTAISDPMLQTASSLQAHAGQNITWPVLNGLFS